MTRWYRAYEGTVTDAKLAEAALVVGCSRSVVIATWHSILENAASLNDGGRIDIPSRRIAAILCEPFDTIETLMAALETVGLVHGSTVVSWKKRQFESDNSTERSRRHRAASRNADATLQQQHATPPETENIEHRTDNKPSSSIACVPSDAASRYQALEKRLREAAGWQSEPSPGLFTVGPIIAVMETGADIDLDILPTIRAKAGKCRSRSSWNFFIDAIKEAHAKRLEAGRASPVQSAATAQVETRKREAERFLAEHNAKVAANG